VFESGVSRAGSLAARAGLAAGSVQQLRRATSQRAAAARATLPDAAPAARGLSPGRTSALGSRSDFVGPPHMAAAWPSRETGTVLVPVAAPLKGDKRPGPILRFREWLGSFVLGRWGGRERYEKGSGRWGDQPLGAWGDGGATRGCYQARRLPRRLPFPGSCQALHSPNPQQFCLRPARASIDRSIQSPPYERTRTRIRAVFASPCVRAGLAVLTAPYNLRGNVPATSREKVARLAADQRLQNQNLVFGCRCCCRDCPQQQRRNL